MNKIAVVLLSLLLAAAFVNCGDNGAGSDDTATIKIMDAPDGSGNEVDLTALTPGSVETLYAVAFDDVSGEFVENVGLDAASLSGQVGNAALVDVGGFIGFGSNQTVVITVNGLSAPSGLASVTLDGAIGLNWTVSADSVSGYNIYRSTDSTAMSTVTATSDTNAYTDNGVTNGTVYYFAVAAMGSGDLILTPSSDDYAAKTYTAEVVSPKTAIVDDAPRPKAQPSEAIWEYDSSGKSSFAWTFDGGGEVLSTNTTNLTVVDIYLEETGGVLSMKSPDLIYTTGTPTVTEFADMGAYAFDAPEVSDASAVSSWSKTVVLTQGNVYAIKLQEGYYIKMIVDEMGPDPDFNDEYYAYITYGFQTIQGYTNFKTASK